MIWRKGTQFRILNGKFIPVPTFTTEGLGRHCTAKLQWDPEEKAWGVWIHFQGKDYCLSLAKSKTVRQAKEEVRQNLFDSTAKSSLTLLERLAHED